jgi:DNA-3-methyladenine glycosylase
LRATRGAAPGDRAGTLLSVRRTEAREGVQPAAAGPDGLLPRTFFDRPSAEVAPDLLGCVFWSDSPQGRVAVRLVEVEAYEGEADPASHAFRGQTRRNAVMYGPAGHAYVYFTYGMHFCVNLVCQPGGEASAVLLRAGQVIEGAELAAERRTARGSGSSRSSASARERDLARGPARLCQALAIDRAFDGTDVCAPGSRLGIGPPDTADGELRISRGPRIGITRAADWPLRFWLTGDRHVSAHQRVTAS